MLTAFDKILIRNTAIDEIQRQLFHYPLEKIDLKVVPDDVFSRLPSKMRAEYETETRKIINKVITKKTKNK